MIVMATRALNAGGERKSLAHVEWDVSNGCHNPFMRILTAREDRPWRAKIRTERRGNTTYYRDHDIDGVTLRRELEAIGPNQFFRLSIWTPCRKCSHCLKRRGQAWYFKAKDEIAAAPRTWFGTLTFAPDKLYLVEAQARHELYKRRIPSADITPARLFAQLAKVTGREVTKFLKRVRKNSSAKIRYLVVIEKHKSGAPHFHILVHEVDEPVRYRVLSAAWQSGFSQFNLVDGAKAAAYVSKYLSKSMLARVRASHGYGNERSE